MPIALFLITVLSRIPFTSKYLFHMDSGHFALALDNFDIVHGQPHPPGYFLYVMLGRAVRVVINDTNTALIVVSILFSGLTVVTMYFLGKELINERIGVLAALLTLTSPNFWFHGEVALSYPADAFFSAFIGLLCWRTLQGRSGHVRISALTIALSSGFRQSTGIFLLPLWLFSMKHEKLRSVASSAGLFCLVSLAWFLPMIAMTGGLESYLGAFGELWTFNTGHNSVFEKGIPHFIVNLEVIYIFFFYNLGVLLPIMLLALYGLARKRELSLLKGDRTLFMAFWMLPTLLFYLLIFISGNPGYALILLPPLVILASASLQYLRSSFPALNDRWISRLAVTAVLALNSAIFLAAKLPVSHNEITTHDANIGVVLKHLRSFDGGDTLIFIGADALYSYRHLMIYLPGSTVYQADVRTSSSGEKRQLFGGKQGRSVATDTLQVPSKVRHFAAVVQDGQKVLKDTPPGLTVAHVTTDISIVSGPIEKALDLYPELKPYWIIEDQSKSTL